MSSEAVLVTTGAGAAAAAHTESHLEASMVLLRWRIMRHLHQALKGSTARCRPRRGGCGGKEAGPHYAGNNDEDMEEEEDDDDGTVVGTLCRRFRADADPSGVLVGREDFVDALLACWGTRAFYEASIKPHTIFSLFDAQAEPPPRNAVAYADVLAVLIVLENHERHGSGHLVSRSSSGGGGGSGGGGTSPAARTLARLFAFFKEHRRDRDAADNLLAAATTCSLGSGDGGRMAALVRAELLPACYRIAALKPPALAPSSLCDGAPAAGAAATAAAAAAAAAASGKGPPPPAYNICDGAGLKREDVERALAACPHVVRAFAEQMDRACRGGGGGER